MKHANMKFINEKISCFIERVPDKYLCCIYEINIISFEPPHESYLWKPVFISVWNEIK